MRNYIRLCDKVVSRRNYAVENGGKICYDGRGQTGIIAVFGQSVAGRCLFLLWDDDMEDKKEDILDLLLEMEYVLGSFDNVDGVTHIELQQDADVAEINYALAKFFRVLNIVFLEWHGAIDSFALCLLKSRAVALTWSGVGCNNFIIAPWMDNNYHAYGYGSIKRLFGVDCDFLAAPHNVDCWEGSQWFTIDTDAALVNDNSCNGVMANCFRYPACEQGTDE